MHPKNALESVKCRVWTRVTSSVCSHLVRSLSEQLERRVGKVKGPATFVVSG
jgi:hypothetical protein